MVQLSFIIVCILAAYLFYRGVNKKLFFLLLWQIPVSILALGGIYHKLPLLLPGSILVSIAIGIHLLWNLDYQKLNLKFLLGIHILRIPVELILYALYIQKRIPELMTFQGWNFDIMIGISALVITVYLLGNKNKLNTRFLITWNLMGILFLVFIVSLALLSSPLPIQQLAFEQPNVAVLQFPYCFLPTFVVPLVLLSHIIMIIKAIRYKSTHS